MLKEYAEGNRNQECKIWLTEEEDILLYKLMGEMRLESRGEVVGRALRVLQKCREFVEE